MGAGASIEDEKDLEKEYNKAKENGTINDDQAAKLKAEYDSIKADPKKGSNEFLVIGKCKKKWDEVVGGGGGGGSSAPAPAPAPAPAAKPFPTCPADFKCKAGPNAVIITAMTDLKAAVDKAKEAKLTPLIIDRSEAHLIDTFYQYNATVMDCKKMGLDVSMRKQPIGEVMDEQRKTIMGAVRHGKTLVMACQTAAPDFVGKFNDDKCGEDLSGAPFKNSSAERKSLIPIGLFEDSGAPIRETAAAEGLFRDGDLDGGVANTGNAKDFSVIVTTHFNYEDLDDFIFSDGFGLPAGKFQPIWIAHEEGTPPLDD